MLHYGAITAGCRWQPRQFGYPIGGAEAAAAIVKIIRFVDFTHCWLGGFTVRRYVGASLSQ